MDLFFPQVDNWWLKLLWYFRHCVWRCGHTHLGYGWMRSLKEVTGSGWTYLHWTLNCAANQAPTIKTASAWKQNRGWSSNRLFLLTEIPVSPLTKPHSLVFKNSLYELYKKYESNSSNLCSTAWDMERVLAIIKVVECRPENAIWHGTKCIFFLVASAPVLLYITGPSGWGYVSLRWDISLSFQTILF